MLKKSNITCPAFASVNASKESEHHLVLTSDEPHGASNGGLQVSPYCVLIGDQRVHAQVRVSAGRALSALKVTGMLAGGCKGPLLAVS